MRDNIAVPVEDLQQWRLLVSVCPIFAHPHPWTATGSDPDDASSVKTQARLFQGIIMEIPVHIPPGSIIPPEFVDALKIDLDDILTQLARLVNGTHLTVPKPGPKGLPEGSDKLWALKELTESNDDIHKPMEHYARYLNLTQDPFEFKRSGRAIERCVVCFSKIPCGTTPGACGNYLQPPKANTWSLKSSFQSTFYQSSKHLFERLVTHLEPCHGRYGGRGNQQNNSEQHHQAMVHLNYSQSVIDGNFSPNMALMLQSCMEEHSAWHQIRCIISSSDRSSSIVNTDVIEEICQVAQEAYNTGRFFMVELRGDIFLDMSDDSESSRYRKDNSQDCAEPTKSMRDLLGCHILSPANYKTGFLPSDKKMLAFTVAHAILHLHPGPWIQSPLTLDNIFFLYDKSTHTIHNIHHPHISCTLARQHPSPDTLESDPRNKYPLLLSFAKFLVELETGEEVLPKSRNQQARASLELPLREFSQQKSRHLLDRHFADALNSALTFQKCIREERLDNPSVTDQEVILKRIVHPLEMRLDMELTKEVGYRSLVLPEEVVAKGHGARQAKVKTSSTPASAATSSKTQRDLQPKVLSLRPSSKQLIPPKTMRATHTGSPSGFKLARCGGESRSRSQTPSQLGAPFPRNSTKSPFTAQAVRSSPPGAHMAQGAQRSESISTETFQLINKTIDERFKHTNKDQPIKIAILDTGLDNSHPDFEKARTKAFVGNQASPAKGEMPQKMRIKEARNFCTDIEQEDNHVQDLDGHGTAIAGTILRLAPRAHLYIARVSLTASDDVQVPESQKKYKIPRPDVVARAIRWAISLKVDILNLSLGFRDISLSQLCEVRDALKEAQDNNMVIFAATSNEGAHQPIAWPANDAQYAIGIHSCNDSGTLRSFFTAPPSQNGANFMVVGENILSQLTTSRGGGFRTWTGSSFATPVATAIGALILAYVRQTVFREEKCEAESQLGAGGLDQLQTNAGMIKILKSFSTLTEGQYWSLSPKLFWGHQLYTSHSDPNRDAQAAKDHAWRMITKALGPSG